jgi:epoxyqueuosine reductase QueG
MKLRHTFTKNVLMRMTVSRIKCMIENQKTIVNLPGSEVNVHDWIDEYCKVCGFCIKQCPTNAILEEPVLHDTGLITHTKQRNCFEYFARYYGCSICVKVCPFSRAGDTYARLKAVVREQDETI